MSHTYESLSMEVSFVRKITKETKERKRDWYCRFNSLAKFPSSISELIWGSSSEERVGFDGEIRTLLHNPIYISHEPNNSLVLILWKEFGNPYLVLMTGDGLYYREVGVTNPEIEELYSTVFRQTNDTIDSYIKKYLSEED